MKFEKWKDFHKITIDKIHKKMQNSNLKKWSKTWFRIDPEKPQFSLINRLSIWYFILLEIPLLIKGLGVAFNFNVRITETGDLIPYTFGLRDTLDIILTGICFRLIIWKLYSSLKTEIMLNSANLQNEFKNNPTNMKDLTINEKQEEKQESKQESRRKREQEKTNKDLVVIAFLLIYSMSVIDHVILNNIHGRLPDDTYGSRVFVEAYFWDEYIGHIGIAIPLYALIAILWINSLQLHPHENFKWFQKAFLFILSLGSGVVMALSFIEGQCAVVLFVFNIIFAIILFLYHFKKNKSILKNPFQFFIFCFIIGFLIAIIAWVCMSGLKSYYPFLYQFSEIG